MLLDHRMRGAGGALFRWRSYVLLSFLPLIALAVTKAEPVEQMIGGFWGEAFELGCILLVLGGLVVRAATAGFVPARTSGRNTRDQVADRLNTEGLYALTRNPLYLGNCMIYLGVVLFTQDLMLSLAFALFLLVYYERIILAEEAFLLDRFGEIYRTWSDDVPAFFPRLSGWRKPSLPFSLRTVIRREYPGWFAAILALGLIAIGQDLFVGDRAWHLDRGWLIAIGLSAAAYGIVHFLKLRTRVLRVPGR